MRIAIVTNIPTPYRNPVFQRLMSYDGIYIHVFFCSPSEPNRLWNESVLEFNHSFLSIEEDKRIHLNWNIYEKLSDYNPDVIITSGFNPTMILAWIWSRLKRRKHIVFSDANIHSEKDLSVLHKLTRKLIFRWSDAFIGASNKTLALFKQYNVPESKMFKSCLSVDNDKFVMKYFEEKEYDLMFCGQFIERKNPLFFVDLAVKINNEKTGIKLLLLGDGPLKNKCLELLDKNEVNYFDAGFVQPEYLPVFYAKSKLFIFPTKRDAWGLVANEALASGVPVLVTSFAGSANELVLDGYNGYVLNGYDLQDWVKYSVRLLNDKELYMNLSLNAVKSVKEYSFDRAAEEIISASISVEDVQYSNRQ